MSTVGPLSGSARRSNSAALGASAQWRSSNTAIVGPAFAMSVKIASAAFDRSSIGRCSSVTTRKLLGVLGVAPDDVEHEREGTPQRAGIGLTGDDPGVGEASEQLTHEAGLADAGLAADQGDGGGFVLVRKAGAGGRALRRDPP